MGQKTPIRATGEQRLLIKPHMLKGAKVIWPDADLNSRAKGAKRNRTTKVVRSRNLEPKGETVKSPKEFYRLFQDDLIHRLAEKWDSETS